MCYKSKLSLIIISFLLVRIVSNAILNKIITNNDLSSSLDLIEKIEPKINDFKKK